MAAGLAPIRRPRANGQRTSMGAILGGGSFDDDPGPSRGSPPRQPPPVPPQAAPAPAPPAAGQRPPAPRPLSPADNEKRKLLESHVAFPRPLPWAPAPPWALGAQQAGALPPAVAYPPHGLNRAPSEPPVVSAAAADVHLSARLATVERRLEAQQEHGERLHHLLAELRQLKEGQSAHDRVADERLAGLERATEISRREFAATSEQFRALQTDFREFATHASARQRAEIEGEVAQALARQRASAEEWHAALRQQNTILQGDISRAVGNIERMSAQLAASTTELRTRIGALEASAMSGRNMNGAGAGANGQMVEHLRQQLDAMRNTAAQASAGVVEIHSKLEGEAAARVAMQRDHEARLAALNHALRSEREDLHKSLAQRLEVLEAKQGVERSDIMARQAELKQEVASGDQLGNAQLQDVAMRLRSELEAMERRLQAENVALKERVDLQMAQLQTTRAAEEEARRASTASLFKRVEATAERQLDAVRGLRQEIDAGLKDAMEAVVAENAGRIEAERRLIADTSEASRTIAHEVAALRSTVQQQAEAVSAELDQIRRGSAERADSLSRYVDDVVAKAVSQNASAVNAATQPSMSEALQDVAERLAALRAAAEEQAAVAEKRLETVAEDLRLRIRRVEEAREKDVVEMRRDAERAAAALERRTAAAQEELRGRFEAYVRHFDSSISSVQAAILRPPRDASLDEISAIRLAHSGVRQQEAPAAQPALQNGSCSYQAPSVSEILVLRSRVAGLRIYAAPDIASEMHGMLSRGDVVVARGVVSDVHGRRWAHLMPGWPVASGMQLAVGGYVVMNTDSGNPLLEQIEGEEGIRHIELSTVHRKHSPRDGMLSAAPTAASRKQADEAAEDLIKKIFGGVDGQSSEAVAHQAVAASASSLESSLAASSATSNSQTGSPRQYAARLDTVAPPGEVKPAEGRICGVCSRLIQKSLENCPSCGFKGREWACDICTKLNHGAKCTQCGSPSPGGAATQDFADAADVRASDDQDDGSRTPVTPVGSGFGTGEGDGIGGRGQRDAEDGA